MTRTKTQTKAPAGAAPIDPKDGSSHPPRRRAVPSSRAATEMRPAMQWMRGAMVREFVRRMKRTGKQRRFAKNAAVDAGLRGRMRKRKAALAMSAAIMGMSTAASSIKSGPNAAPLIELDIDPTTMRVPVSDLKVSEDMKAALAEEEGVRLTVYRDVAGYPTVGVGHLVTPADGLRVGDTITYEQALEFLEQDLAIAEEGVRKLASELPLYQHEFDALVDLVYNVGEGNVSERESPLLNAAIAAGDYDGIAEQLHYHHAGGAKANGLVYRSERRQMIFMDASYDDPRAVAVAASGQVSA